MKTNANDSVDMAIDDNMGETELHKKLKNRVVVHTATGVYIGFLPKQYKGKGGEYMQLAMQGRGVRLSGPVFRQHEHIRVGNGPEGFAQEIMVVVSPFGVTGELSEDLYLLPTTIVLLESMDKEVQKMYFSRIIQTEELIHRLEARAAGIEVIGHSGLILKPLCTHSHCFIRSTKAARLARLGPGESRSASSS